MRDAADICDQKQGAYAAMSERPEDAPEWWQLLYDLAHWRMPTARDWANGAVQDEFAALQRRAGSIIDPATDKPSLFQQEEPALVERYYAKDYPDLECDVTYDDWR